jgi:hypothetical protein
LRSDGRFHDEDERRWKDLRGRPLQRQYKVKWSHTGALLEVAETLQELCFQARIFGTRANLGTRGIKMFPSSVPN